MCRGCLSQPPPPGVQGLGWVLEDHKAPLDQPGAPQGQEALRSRDASLGSAKGAKGENTTEPTGAQSVAAACALPGSARCPPNPGGDEERAAHLEHRPKQPLPGYLELLPGGPGTECQQRPASTHEQGQGEGKQAVPQPLPPPPPAG